MTGVSAAGMRLAMLDSIRQDAECRLLRQVDELSAAIDQCTAAELRVMACARNVVETRSQINEMTQDMRYLVDRRAA